VLKVFKSTVEIHNCKVLIHELIFNGQRLLHYSSRNIYFYFD